MENTPTDILWTIGGFLELPDLLQISMLNKRFNKIFTDPQFFKQHIRVTNMSDPKDFKNIYYINYEQRLKERVNVLKTGLNSDPEILQLLQMKQEIKNQIRELKLRYENKISKLESLKANLSSKICNKLELPILRIRDCKEYDNIKNFPYITKSDNLYIVNRLYSITRKRRNEIEYYIFNFIKSGKRYMEVTKFPNIPERAMEYGKSLGLTEIQTLYGYGITNIDI